MEKDKKIGFFCDWGEDRTNCWSGTPYGVFTALEKIYNVVDHPINHTYLNKVIVHTKKLLNKVSSKNYDFIEDYNKKMEKQLNNIKIFDGEEAIIMFSGFISKHINKSYSYQDLTASYLASMYENNSELIKYSPLANVDIKSYLKNSLNREKQFCDECKGLFIMSHWLCEFMKTSGIISPSKVHFVGAGCNIDTSKIDYSQKDGNKFLFIGKDFERKNGFLVIEAFNLLHKKYPHTELYIAGPQTAEECGELGEGIMFLGRKSYDELVYYYNLCDYFVMPSQFEAYGIVFGEALIYGLPCIGKNCFAMPEFIQDSENGFLIENNDKYELADKMQRLLENKQIAKNVIKQKSEYIKLYSWDATAERIYNIIKSESKNS